MTVRENTKGVLLSNLSEWYRLFYQDSGKIVTTVQPGHDGLGNWLNASQKVKVVGGARV